MCIDLATVPRLSLSLSSPLASPLLYFPLSLRLSTSSTFLIMLPSFCALSFAALFTIVAVYSRIRINDEIWNGLSVLFFLFRGLLVSQGLRLKSEGTRIGKIGERSFTCWCVNIRGPVSWDRPPVLRKKDNDKWMVWRASDWFRWDIVNLLRIHTPQFFYCT